jgi:hypothetical protein
LFWAWREGTIVNERDETKQGRGVYDTEYNEVVYDTEYNDPGGVYDTKYNDPGYCEVSATFVSFQISTLLGCSNPGTRNAQTKD